MAESGSSTPLPKSPSSSLPKSPSSPLPKSPSSPLPKCPSSPLPKCPSNRILRCFSGRYSVTEDEVKRFINIAELVSNDKAKEIFRHFLETNKTSLTLPTLKCYELSDQLLNDVKCRTEENYDELKELMPAFLWRSV